MNEKIQQMNEWPAVFSAFTNETILDDTHGSQLEIKLPDDVRIVGYKDYADIAWDPLNYSR